MKLDVEDCGAHRDQPWHDDVGVITINTIAENPPLTSPMQTSIVVISRNKAYRSALLAALTDKGLRACAASFETETGGQMDAELGVQPGVETIRGGQMPEPQVVVVDGSFIADVAAARSAWSSARLIGSLDYIADWEHVRFLGADACVLKDQGLAAILSAIPQPKIAKTRKLDV